MRLSIIIPCYNMEAYLRDCVNSLLDQGLDDTSYEIIIVNDGSEDATLTIAKQFEEQYKQVRVIDKANAGVGTARNSGLDQATGHYIYFLDPDDYLAKNSLQEILELTEKLELDVLTFCSRPVKKNEYIRASNTKINGEISGITDGITYISQRKFPNEIWWYLVSRKFLKENQLRFIEGRWMEDAILTAQIFCKAKTMAHIPRDVHRYRILPTSAMRNKTPEHYNKVIFDNANAAHVFDGLIKQVPSGHPFANGCINRLKTRQQSFVFFLLVRLMKSDLPVNKIPKMLRDFQTIDAYPLHNFLGKDYHGFSYLFMVYIFNHKPLIKPFVKVFRTFYPLLR